MIGSFRSWWSTVPRMGRAIRELGALSWVKHRTFSPAAIIRTVANAMTEVYGSFLVIEVWASRIDRAEETSPIHRAEFSIRHRGNHDLDETVTELSEALRAARILRTQPVVSQDLSAGAAPAWMRQLFTARELDSMSTSFLGIAVKPVYRDAVTQVLFPGVLRSTARKMGVALDRGA